MNEMTHRRRIGGLDAPSPDGSEDGWEDTEASLAEAAFGLICNVDGCAQGWQQRDEWVEAADRWVARYERVISAKFEEGT